MVLFVALGIGWRVLRHRRRHGSTGIVLFRSGRLGQHARDASLLLLPAVLGVLALLAAFALCGFVLMVPNWLSLAAFVASYAAIRSQVGEEEAYLVRTYGDEYRAYARRVGRFVPGVGRLR